MAFAVTDFLSQLRHHHAALSTLLASHEDYNPAQVSLKLLWKAYKQILQDALSVLQSLINYLSK